MKLAIALAALAAAAAPAAAEERTMFVSASGSIGVGSPESTPSGGEPDTEGTLLARVVASWEEAPLVLDEEGRARNAGGVAPEVMLGVIRVADHRNGDVDDNSDLFIAVGGRVERRHASGGGGFLARGAVYAAARIGLLADEHRTPLVEGALGFASHARANVRWGVELGVMGIFAEKDEPPVFDDLGGGATARAPWLDGTGDYVSGHLTVFAGFAL